MCDLSYCIMFKITLQLYLLPSIPLPVVSVFTVDHAQKDELQNLRHKRFVTTVNCPTLNMMKCHVAQLGPDRDMSHSTVQCILRLSVIQ